MNLDRTPLPRFWYLPRGEKAAFVMSGDDHGRAGTSVHFDRFEELSPPGCSVADWGCVRWNSYVFPGSGLTSSAANAYQAAGLEIALHLDTGCGNFTTEVAARKLGEPAAGLPAAIAGRDRAAHQPHALHRLERLGERARSRGRTACGSTRTTTTGPARGSRTVPACSRARASRSASRTSTAR